MKTTPDSRRSGMTQFGILAMSTFLIGLYFGHDLPSGVDLITLQTGLIGIMAFLSLNHLTRITSVGAITHEELNLVETRLQRYVDNQGRVHRFDEAEDVLVRQPIRTEERATSSRRAMVQSDR